MTVADSHEELMGQATTRVGSTQTTTEDAAGAAPPAYTEQPRPIRPGLVLMVLAASVFLMILNKTVLTVALPQIMVDFGVEAATGQWLTTGFLLTMAIVIPTTGYLTNRFSTRSIFVAARSIFIAGSLIGAIAPSFGWLLLARIVQAAAPPSSPRC
ncbi:MFS transporter [Parenemella sanctibonifatiensis]|uniref:MFS transporter n=1 Tax=Parenemella sanctibonifatiensis TaxID=2016505 RepID=UPI001E3240D2|nr:MFS transporter [Parenemella sanctibonifatiensis]